ncbi:MAG: hypothetical protein Q7K34_04180 [archaeon]|nr:hypothetical protein [archaeon]
MIEKFNSFMAATVSPWLLALVVIAAELFPPFKALLASVFSHHWIGKLVITLGVFVLVGFLVKKQATEKTAFYSIIGGLLVILAFYIFVFFKG